MEILTFAASSIVAVGILLLVIAITVYLIYSFSYSNYHWSIKLISFILFACILGWISMSIEHDKKERIAEVIQEQQKSCSCTCQ